MKRAHRAQAPLAGAAAIAFVATTDPAKSRAFYETTLGLRFVADEPFALVFDLAGTMLRIAKVQHVAPARHTVLGWRVQDIAVAMRELEGRGVRFERYPGTPQDEDGVFHSPSGAKVAWFLDPDGNALSLTEFPA